MLCPFATCNYGEFGAGTLYFDNSVMIFACVSNVQSELVISFGDQAGLGTKLTLDEWTRATLWVNAYDLTVASPLDINTYSFAFRIGNDSTIPAVFSNFSVDFTGGLIPTAPPPLFGLDIDPANLQLDPVPGHNIIVSNDQGALGTRISNNAAAKSRLFSISFDIAQGSPGVYGFS